MTSKIHEILLKEKEVCDLHASRLRLALEALAPLLPLTVQQYQNLDTHMLGMLELLTSRFSKLQDTMGERVFPYLLEQIGEDTRGKSFIDRLQNLEKLEIIEDAQSWMRYRELRNSITHEYPAHLDLLVTNISQAAVASKTLISLWEKIRLRIDA